MCQRLEHHLVSVGPVWGLYFISHPLDSDITVCSQNAVQIGHMGVRACKNQECVHALPWCPSMSGAERWSEIDDI